jgi:glucokinase
VLAIGVDVGGTSVRAGVVDEQGTLLDTARVGTPSGEAALEDAIAGVIEDLRNRHEAAAVGLAVAAPVADRIAKRVGLPMTLEHDANAAAVGEHRFGAARGAGVAVLVAVGTGIGAGLLLDGTIYRGAHGVAPELGHLTVVPGGRACPCGKYGCWERYCSGTALAATAVEMLARHPGRSTVLRRETHGDPGSVTGRRVAGAARDGDPVALRAMGELAKWLGEGLALVADVFDPEVIVIAGGVSESAPLFLDEAREHYTGMITGAGHRPLARIRTAQLGVDAAIVGAAAVAMEEAAAETQVGVIG